MSLAERAGLASNASRKSQAMRVQRLSVKETTKPSIPSDGICAGSGFALDEFKLFQEGCKPKWFLEEGGVWRKLCLRNRRSPTCKRNAPEVQLVLTGICVRRRCALLLFSADQWRRTTKRR